MKTFIVAAALLIAAPAAAQTPDPTPVEGKHGAAYVSYGYTSGSSASLDNIQFDVDLAVPGTVVSFTGHFTDQTGVHVGPTAGYQIGPINIFGRHLFLVGADDAAAAAIGNKTGGGVEIPMPKGAILRLSIHNHQKGGEGVDETHHRSRRKVLMQRRDCRLKPWPPSTWPNRPPDPKPIFIRVV